MKKQPSLRGRAIAYLARREHSRAELARKLAGYVQDNEDLSGLLDELERRKLLSDQRYAEARTHTLASKYGRARIVHELRMHGLAEGSIAQIAGELQHSELERAKGVWRKRFGRLPANPEERARQHRFLLGRGFSAELIQRIIRRAEQD